LSKPTETTKSLKVCVITVSDTRTEETDKSGKLIQNLLEEKNHKVIEKVITKDSVDGIQGKINEFLKNEKIDVIITNGGTGISRRDVTIEAVHPILDKEIPGFGEIFRTLSYYEDIGSSTIMSRAIAGVAHDKAIFVMPGSSGAVKLAMNKIILPELHHVVHEITKQ